MRGNSLRKGAEGDTRVVGRASPGSLLPPAAKLKKENWPQVLDSKFMAATAPQSCPPRHQRWDVIIR